MGTRINVIFDHDLTDWSDRPEVVRRLNLALAVACRVDAYWNRVDSVYRTETPAWSIEPQPSRCDLFQMYDGPGALFVSVNPKAVRIHTGGRWRGFLTIEPLREVHLVAFHAIARALGGREMILFSDSESVDEVFWDGQNYAASLQRLTETEGQPQPMIETIDPQIVRDCEHGVPAVWYRERVLGAKE
jgi:hypothetical protein